jgi:hypothetical protein
MKYFPAVRVPFRNEAEKTAVRLDLFFEDDDFLKYIRKSSSASFRFVLQLYLMKEGLSYMKNLSNSLSLPE